MTIMYRTLNGTYRKIDGILRNNTRHGSKNFLLLFVIFLDFYEKELRSTGYEIPKLALFYEIGTEQNFRRSPGKFLLSV